MIEYPARARRLAPTVVFACLLSVAAGPGLAQDCLNYQDFLHRTALVDLGSWVCDVVIAGDRAIAATGDHRLQVLDLAAPDTPVPIGELPTANVPWRVVVAGDRAVVASRNAYLSPPTTYQIVDLSVPEQPVVLGELTLDHGGEDLAVVDDHAFVAAGGAGLVVLDLSEPAVPTVLAQVAVPDTCRGIAIHGNLALMAAEQAGLQVLDISDPAAPELLGGVALPGEVKGVAAAGSYAFVASYPGGLIVVDLADPANPVVIATAPGAYHEVELAGDIAFARKYTAICSFDISDPLAPAFLGELNTGTNANALAIGGDRVLVATEDLMIADSTNPAGAPPAAVMTESVIAQRVVGAGTFAYVADEGHWIDEGGGLRIYDLTDPANPLTHAFVSLEGCDRLAFDDGLVYAAADTGLVIVDVADPDDPAILGVWEHDILFDVWDLTARSGYVYIAALSGGFVVIDATVPAAPVEVAPTHDYGFAARLVSDGGDRIFVNGLNNGFQVLSLADPAHPEIVASFPRAAYEFPYYHGGMALRDERLWVANGTSGVFVIDVSDLDATAVVGWVDTPSFAHDVVLSGDGAFVADRYGGLQVLDISQPLAPTLVGNLAVSDGAQDVAAMAGGSLVVTGGFDGVFVAWPQCFAGPDPVADVAPTPLRLTAWPNPFNPATTIGYAMPAAGHVRLAVHDLRGRLITVLVDAPRAAGVHEVVWNGRDADGRAVPSGVYLSRLETGGRAAYGRMTLVK